jgi:DNA polymerase I-3'-5' exonuclease and polymerase domains
MKALSIDLETYSSVDLGKSSVYRYVESPDFDILLLGFSADGSQVQVVDLAQGEQIPPEIIDALSDERVHKWAFNANFERVCLSEWLRRNSYPLHNEHYSTPDDPCMGYLDPVGWHCTMVWSAYLGLPLSLKDVGAALGLDKQKLTEGKDLIKYFCVPGKDGQRHLPADAPDKWSIFKAYNLRDVETEMGIQERLRKYPVPDAVWDQYHLDQQINDRGIAVDMALVCSAISIDERSREELTAKLKELTMLDNPNSVQQMKDWLADNGLETETLGKKQVTELLKTAPEPLRSVLVLRQQLAKSSVKKYQAMEATVCADGRVRGCFQFYGARTGRWAGRNIQLQNLPQNKMPDLEQARAIVRAGDYAGVRMLYDSIPDVLSQLIRTAFVPRSGHTFFVADFSAIEARVIAWLACEDWRQQVFAEGKDIYCASASQMFGVPVEKHGINGHLRQKGKIAELALGYGGSVGALKAMGALEMGLQEEELKPLVDAWRTANPMIVKLWWAVDDAVMTAIRMKSSAETHGIRFACRSGMLFITLPSGRQLSYVKPRIGENQFGSPAATYMGTNAARQWDRLESYGPKFVENIVQAISRDILCYAMQTLRHCFIVAHVHDELIIEVDPRMSLEAVCEQMGRTPPWAPGLQLRADGYATDFYKKD